MAIFFYMFASLMVISSILVVNSKNPVYSVLWLIFTFCNAAGLIILLGSEFLAMMLIIIYVGAVAVLFIFVIMMLDINIAEIKGDIRRNLSVGTIIALIMLADFVFIILLGTKSIDIGIKGFAIDPNIGNTESIGKVLYTDFILPFQAAGIILFVAMISCITLTLRHRINVKRQDIVKQLLSNKKLCLSVLKPELNSGIEGIKYDE
jgi:NADH-quinone oxidoreductase subunit J